ncbi:MAG TPA: hypothetical protein ENH82_12065 [bacterium]|nr:hypothetical protein [bacterium]
MLKWTIEILVDKIWIIDGFNPTDEQIQNCIESLLPFSTDGEVVAKITKRPSKKKIKQLQG